MRIPKFWCVVVDCLRSPKVKLTVCATPILKSKTNLSKYHQLCFTFITFFLNYENIQLSHLMNANICYYVFNFPERKSSPVCQSIRNKRTECMPMGDKADLCLSVQGNLCGCISIWWWHVCQPGLQHRETLMNLIRWMVPININLLLSQLLSTLRTM